MNFDPQEARLGALLANRAYDIGHTNIPNSYIVGEFAFFTLETETDFYVAGPGTDNPTDFLLDSDAVLEPHPLLPAMGNVHRGFGKVLSAIAGPVAASIPSGKAIKVRGHSMFGSVAQLLTAYLSLRGHPVSNCYGFGTAGIGDAAWVAAYQALNVPTFEVIHGRDEIPYLGFMFHAGQKVFLDHYGVIIQNRLSEEVLEDIRDALADHSIDKYLTVLDKLTL